MATEAAAISQVASARPQLELLIDEALKRRKSHIVEEIAAGDRSNPMLFDR